MKKYLLLFVSTICYAAPVGNGAAPDLIEKGFLLSGQSWMTLRAGYEGDFVADGRMKQFNQSQGRVDKYEQATNSGLITCDFVERLDVYGVFGSSKTKADWRFNLTAADTIHRIELETKTNFLWALGARAILYEWSHLFLGLGGRYSSADYQSNWMTSDGHLEPVVGTQVQWTEWQLNLDFSYKIKLFTPYIGVKYSRAKTLLGNFPVPIAANGSGSNSFENRDPVGLYIGCGLSTGQYFMLNIEGRLIDEEAITISGEFKF